MSLFVWRYYSIQHTLEDFLDNSNNILQRIRDVILDVINGLSKYFFLQIYVTVY